MKNGSKRTQSMCLYRMFLILLCVMKLVDVYIILFKVNKTCSSSFRSKAPSIFSNSNKIGCFSLRSLENSELRFTLAEVNDVSHEDSKFTPISMFKIKCILRLKFSKINCNVYLESLRLTYNCGRWRNVRHQFLHCC